LINSVVLENHRLGTCHWQTSSLKVVSSTSHYRSVSNS